MKQADKGSHGLEMEMWILYVYIHFCLLLVVLVVVQSKLFSHSSIMWLEITLLGTVSVFHMINYLNEEFKWISFVKTKIDWLQIKSEYIGNWNDVDDRFFPMELVIHLIECVIVVFFCSFFQLLPHTLLEISYH